MELGQDFILEIYLIFIFCLILVSLSVPLYLLVRYFELRKQRKLINNIGKQIDFIQVLVKDLKPTKGNESFYKEMLGKNE